MLDLKKGLKVISFDADDTLWPNEKIFREAEKDFCTLMASYASEDIAKKHLWAAEIRNLPLYGYGIKAFTLDMIETAFKLSKDTVKPSVIKKILLISHRMLLSPIVLLTGAKRTIKELSKEYKIIVATKGDLLEQENKIYKSGLSKYLHHIEVMSEKNKRGYTSLLKELGVKPQEFLMVGNSIKSDILPVLSLGAKAVFIPSPLTWFYEDGV